MKGQDPRTTTLEYRVPVDRKEVEDKSDEDLGRIADALEYIAELERIKVRRDYMDMPTLGEWKKSKND